MPEDGSLGNIRHFWRGARRRKPWWLGTDWLMRDKRIYRERDPWREKIGRPARQQSATKPPPPPTPWGEVQQPATETPKQDGDYYWRGALRRRPWYSNRPPMAGPPPRRGLPLHVAIIAVMFGLICAGAAYAALTYLRPAFQPLNALAVRVIDGDTISIAGVPQNIRLVGFNAPETSEPQCSLEGGLGKSATDRLRRLVATNDLDFAYVRCACRLGTAGTSDCNFGRACGSLRVGGEDVGDVLVAEGLAVPFDCGWTSCPKLPRPWCGEVAPATAPAPPIGSGQTPGNCVIKGNVSINSGERIYHMPGQEFYDETRIQPQHGERWFCTEAEARAAGWRKARR
jgi:endonuclease YncB( thermonuclease family)